MTWDLSRTNQALPNREYYYEVYYTYVVDDEFYVGSRYSLGDGSNAAGKTYSSEEDAE
ncbi:MAG: hypothetical protein R3C44_03965 [Chloroflexota bacterium]